MFLYFLAIVVLYVIIKIHGIFKTEMCKCKTQMVGKVVIVTGSNTGIGYETAKDLARRGARVILACRNQEKAHEARETIIKETGNKDIVVKHLDLTSLQSVRDFATDIIATEPKLHVLINNAGTGGNRFRITKDNLLSEAQVNHFSPFLLTTLLLPKLKESAPSRIINLTSVMHKFGKIDLANFHKQPKSYLDNLRVYSNTKLANLLFTVKLSKELEGSGVTVNCLHPGAVKTKIFKCQSAIVRLFVKIFFISPYEGAQTSIHLAVSPKVENVTGKYFIRCREANTSKRAQDLDLANNLRELSHKICS